MARVPKATPQQRSRVITVGVMVLAHGEGLDLPSYQTKGAVGLDLVAAVPEKVPLKLRSGGFAMVPTGLTFEIPPGFEAQVRPRSGLAAKDGVTVLNAPGTIDSDYRGEVKVILINHGAKTFTIKRGMRIAQMVLAPVTHAALTPTKRMSATSRGAGGFGSTGVATSRPAAARKGGKSAIKATSRQRARPRRPGRT